MRGVNGLVLAAQHVGNLLGQPAKHGAVGINDVPFPLIHIHFGQICFHFKSNTEQRSGENIKLSD
jgi:hypothetical protein